MGVSHPSPLKAQQFREIDLRSVKASVDAAATAGVTQFIYVSVNQAPSRIMKAYQEVRREGENYCIEKKLNCTFLRPWYVLGPGHWWPVTLLPLFAIASIVPSWRRTVGNRSFVTINQMILTLLQIVKDKPLPLRILEIPQIKSF